MIKNMKSKLEVKLVNAYLNKEISNLEKEMGLNVITNHIDTFKKLKLSIDEIFNQILVIGNEYFQDITNSHSKEEIDNMAINVKKFRENI